MKIQFLLLVQILGLDVVRICVSFTEDMDFLNLEKIKKITLHKLRADGLYKSAAAQPIYTKFGMPAVISNLNTTDYPANYQTPQTRRGFRIFGLELKEARN